MDNIHPTVAAAMWFAPPQGDAKTGDFDIPLPDEDEPIHSDFGRLEAPCPVATMEEQRRVALANSSREAWASVQRDVHAGLKSQADDAPVNNQGLRT